MSENINILFYSEIYSKEMYFWLKHFQLIWAQCSISYENWSPDLLCNSNDWFVYEFQHWVEMNKIDRLPTQTPLAAWLGLGIQSPDVFSLMAPRWPSRS